MRAAVSIHAPVKVRPAALSAVGQAYRFNSRTCEGATFQGGLRPARSNVSIHAPVKVRPGIKCASMSDAWFQFTHL